MGGCLVRGKAVIRNGGGHGGGEAGLLPPHPNDDGVRYRLGFFLCPGFFTDSVFSHG